MERYETRTRIDKDLAQEVKKKIHSSRERKGFLIVAVAAFLVGFGNANEGNIPLATVAFVACFGFVLMYFRSSNSLTIGGGKISDSAADYITSFPPEGIKVSAANGGEEVTIPYDTVTRFLETEQLYVLFTRKDQVIPVNKLSLAEEKKSDDFLRFTKVKCENIRSFS
ncbi:MAG: YcxB family protein [Oscillospiraceae bacterium]|nr:YcxB family protein [Oscillospiraceae bacterium]